MQAQNKETTKFRLFQRSWFYFLRCSDAQFVMACITFYSVHFFSCCWRCSQFKQGAHVCANAWDRWTAVWRSSQLYRARALVWTRARALCAGVKEAGLGVFCLAAAADSAVVNLSYSILSAQSVSQLPFNKSVKKLRAFKSRCAQLSLLQHSFLSEEILSVLKWFTREKPRELARVGPRMKTFRQNTGWHWVLQSEISHGDFQVFWAVFGGSVGVDHSGTWR